MKGVRRIVSDQHSAQQTARKSSLSIGSLAMMPVSHDAQCHALHSKTPDAKGDVEGLRAVILSKDQHAAHEELRRLVAKYQTTAPSFDDLAEKNAPGGLTIIQLPPEHRERMGMTNPIEQLN
jgi:transposase-like protein